jgi:hypothetical protein
MCFKVYERGAIVLVPRRSCESVMSMRNKCAVHVVTVVVCACCNRLVKPLFERAVMSQGTCALSRHVQMLVVLSLHSRLSLCARLFGLVEIVVCVWRIGAVMPHPLGSEPQDWASRARCGWQRDEPV